MSGRGIWRKILLVVLALGLLAAAAGSALTAFSAESSLKSATMAFTGIFLGLFGVMILVDMFQSDQDDLMDEYYGVGGKTGGYGRHHRGRKIRWRWSPQVDTDPGDGE